MLRKRFEKDNKFSMNIVFLFDSERNSIIIWKILYSVMQSDGNSFCGDVLLNSLNMVYSDKDQKYGK